MAQQKKSETPQFSRIIDNLIIDGFFEDELAMYEKLQKMGFSKEVITTRSKQLGLSRQFLKRYPDKKSEAGMRECLRCSEKFLSAGFQNRLCSRCTNRQ